MSARGLGQPEGAQRGQGERERPAGERERPAGERLPNQPPSASLDKALHPPGAFPLGALSTVLPGRYFQFCFTREKEGHIHHGLSLSPVVVS